MESFTIGHISGGIAAAAALLQFILPNAVIVLLVATLSDRHTAATWSVAGRQILASQWPLLMRSDTVAFGNVHNPVRWLAWIRPTSILLVAVAAIVTPMGLYETVGVSPSPSRTTFRYVRDTGVMGQGTTPRSDLGFSRYCGGEDKQTVYPCPGTRGTPVKEAIWNSTIPADNGEYDGRIASVLADLYQSGCSTQARTVSSFFDIEHRNNQKETTTSSNNRTQTMLVPTYKKIRTFVQQDTIELVEGLIVDTTQSPKIGFRNHTVPVDVQIASEWEEDILFMEPDTSCININLTYDARVKSITGPLTILPAYLVDHGGFSQLNKTNPWPDDLWHGGQLQQPSLEHRAYSAGWFANLLMMSVLDLIEPTPQKIRLYLSLLNTTLNATLDEKWSLDNSFLNNNLGMDRISLASYDLIMTDQLRISSDSYKPSNYTYLGSYPPLNETIYPNPLQVDSEDFTNFANLCQGWLGGDKVNKTNLQSKCGLMAGLPNFLNGSDSDRLIHPPGSPYSRPFYSCASATKMSIKTVRFRYNASTASSSELKNLEVMTIRDKEYDSDMDLPLWGAETPDMNISDINPLWGLIAKDRQDSVNLTTLQSRDFYVPTGYNAYWGFEAGSDYMPASGGVASTWTLVYEALSPGATNSPYSGEDNLALFNKWHNFSQTEYGAATIINLVFTDLAANYFVGTKSQLSPAVYLPPNLQPQLKKRDGDFPTEPGQVFVYQHRRIVRYRWLFGIPALICLVLCSIICTFALVSMLLGKGHPRRIRHYLYNLSAGRILASKIYPIEGNRYLNSDTRSWVTGVGAMHVTLRHQHDSISESSSRDGDIKYQPVQRDEQVFGSHAAR